MHVKYLMDSPTFVVIKEKSVARVEQKIRMKPVSDVAMYENPEDANMSLGEALIKINDLENKFVFSSIRIAQCEKEKCDLITIIEKLYEKFINKPLDNMIDKLESKLSLLNEEISLVEQSNDNEESSNSNSDVSIADNNQQPVESGSQPETDLGNKITDGTNCAYNDWISLSSDCESIVDNQDSIDNEANIDTADLIAKVKESLKRVQNCANWIRDSMTADVEDPTTGPESRCNEKISTIHGEDDTDESDHSTTRPELRCNEEVPTICDVDDTDRNVNQLPSRPTVPLVIDLSDLSSQSDAEECFLLSDDSNFSENSTINQPRRNFSSETLRKESLSEDVKWILPNANDNCDSNLTTRSKNNQQQDNPSDSSLNSTSEVSDEQSTQVGEDILLERDQRSNKTTNTNIKQENPSFFEVLQNPAIIEIDDSSTSSANSENVTSSEINLENSFSDILQKLNPVKFDDSSIAIGAEVYLSQKNDSNGIKYYSERNTISSANLENLMVVEVDDSLSTQSYEDVVILPSENSNSSTCWETDLRKKSSLDIARKIDPYEFCDSLDELLTPVYSPQNDDSNSASKNKQKSISDFYERKPNLKQLLKEEPDMEQVTNSRKRAKFDRRASWVHFRRYFFSSQSTISPFEEMRRKNRLPSWPCPCCDECFTNAFFYSKHLNQKHVGDERVFTCSICHFVSPTITARKRHVNKRHSGAFLMGNSIQYVRHLNQDHDYAATNFTFV